MMTAMIKHSDSHSESENSDSPQPPPSTSYTRPPHSISKSSHYQTNIKSKLLSLKNKNPMHRSSPTKPLSSSNICNTPPVLDNYSLPPPDFNLHINPHNNLSTRHSQSSPLSQIHFSIIHFSLMIQTMTIPQMILPYTMYGNQPKFTPYSTIYQN